MSTPVPSSGLEQVKCVACGEEFGCGANVRPGDAIANCWCSAIEITDESLAEMQARYQGCLCRKCLTSFNVDERA